MKKLFFFVALCAIAITSNSFAEAIGAYGFTARIKFDTSIMVESCNQPILAPINLCNGQKSKYEKVIGWKAQPNMLKQVSVSSDVSFSDEYLNQMGYYYKGNNSLNFSFNDLLKDLFGLLALIAAIGLLILAFKKIHLGMIRGPRNPVNQTESVSPRYNADDIVKIMNAFDNGGHIDHKINKDGESLYVKKYPPEKVSVTSQKSNTEEKKNQQ